jgi:adenosylmethionine-8-amino-7-oxononanoate aminotransferase
LVFSAAAAQNEAMADASRSLAYPLLPRGRAPLEIARAEGCWLETPDGRRILDAAGGAIVASVGHGRAEVAEAVAAALKETTYVVPPFATPHRVRLVERLREAWLPEGITRCVFTSGGSESVDLALRVVRQHFVAKGEPSRWKVIGRELSYHGTTLATLAVGGQTKRRRGLEPLLFPSPKIPAPYRMRCGPCAGESACTLACADALEETILREDPETVAAFIAEPIGGSTAGALVPPPGWWPRVMEICRRYGVLVIADEVMCGFGRTGARFAVEHFDVTPDLLVAGKGLAAGYAPIGGVYTREEVVAPIAEAGLDVMFFTFSAHPASCAAADAVLAILEREGLVERAAKMGELLTRRLAPLADHPHVAEVRGRGLLQAVELVRRKPTFEPFATESQVTARVVGAGLRRGVFLYPGGCDPARDVVCLGPPLVVSEEEVELMARVLAEAVDEVTTQAAAEVA